MRLDALAPGIYSGTVSFATSDPNQNPFNFTITGTASLVLTLDDTAGGFSATSDWLSYVGVGWQNEIRYKQVGSGSEPASWTFSGLNPGQYRVWTTWAPYPNRVTDAAYTVLDGSTAVGTVAVNQQLTPSSLNDGGAWWQQLGGTYTISGNTLVVRLSDLADPAGAYLIADAVRIEWIGGSVSGPQAQVLDGSNIVADGTGSIDLGRTDIGTAVTRSFTVRNLGSSALTLGTISLPSGFSLASDFGATTLAPGASTTFSVRLDALAPGIYSGTVSFATSDPNQNPFNFTITGTASLVLTLDDTAGGFSATSDWLSYVGVGWQNEIRYKQVGSGSEPASWTFSGLNPGQYRVWTTWAPYPNRVTDAAYTVLDGSTAVGTVAVNQQLTPSSLNDGGAWWQQLGGTYTISGNTLVVRLSDLADPAGAYLIADAVRIEWIGGSVSGLQAQVLDGSNIVSDGTGSIDLGRTDIGTAVTRSFTVRNLGSSALTLGTISLPSGFSLASDFGATTLRPGRRRPSACDWTRSRPASTAGRSASRRATPTRTRSTSRSRGRPRWC